MRASKFFGKSETGTDVCAFCAAQIKGELAKEDFIKDTFTDYGELLRPGSPYICAGCAASLGDCVQPVLMIDGTQKTDKPGAGKALANRMFSWVCHGDQGAHQATTRIHPWRARRRRMRGGPQRQRAKASHIQNARFHCRRTARGGSPGGRNDPRGR